MDKQEQNITGKAIIITIIVILVFIAALMYVIPVYKVWQKELAGKAELKQAEWNRQITIKEAEAKLEAEKLNANQKLKGQRVLLRLTRLLVTA